MAGEIDPVCVVNDAVEDGVGVSGVADPLLPPVAGDLAGELIAGRWPRTRMPSMIWSMRFARSADKLPTRRE